MAGRGAANIRLRIEMDGDASNNQSTAGMPEPFLWR